MVYNAIDISKYVIEQSKQYDASITNLKLQKILYYIQGYALKIGETAFDDDIVNWAYGPVVQEVYYRYCSYVSNPINENFEDDDDYLSFKRNHKMKKIRKIIDVILEKTKNMHPFELVRMTHNETPWKSSKRDEVIDKEIIRNYFDEYDPLEIGNEI